MPIQTQFPSTFFKPYVFAPVNITLPTVSGTAEVGETLTVSNGDWAGTAPFSYAYQWRRDGDPITGATSSTYQLVNADADTQISASVTASNTRGNSTATSEARIVLFEDTFTRSNGAVGNNWQSAVTSATITSNQLIITPALGTNLFANSGFDSDTSWTHNSDYTIASGVATKNNTNTTGISQSSLLTLNEFYVQGVGSGSSSNTLHYLQGIFTGANIALHTRDGVPSSLSGWARQTGAGFTTISSGGVLDNVFVQPITAQVVWRTQNFINGLATITTRFTAPVGAQQNASNVGVAHFLDDDNYVAVIIDRATGSQTVSCVTLVAVISGQISILGASNLAAIPSVNTDYVMKLARSGSLYTAYWGDDAVVSAALSPDFLSESTEWGILANNEYWIRVTNYTFQGAGT